MPDIQRKVVIVVPDNVWFHLRELKFPGAPASDFSFHGLELLKAMYGLNEAPLLWQLCLRHFLIKETGARCSHFDDNFFYWKLADGTIEARPHCT